MLRLARQGADILAFSPIVAAGRMMRLAAQRPAAAATALGNMGLEKVTTFGQAWMAMVSAGMQAQFKFAVSMWMPRTPGSARSANDRAGSDLTDAIVSMASSAMQPLHVRVKRNAGKRKRG
jgi:hypothetical protein